MLHVMIITMNVPLIFIAIFCLSSPALARPTTHGQGKFEDCTPRIISKIVDEIDDHYPTNANATVSIQVHIQKNIFIFYINSTYFST